MAVMSSYSAVSMSCVPWMPPVLLEPELFLPAGDTLALPRGLVL
ncbi:hypothetical protein ACFYNW_34045 [Streptomyces virginiae]